MSLRRKLTDAGLVLGLLAAFGVVVSAQQPSTQEPGPGQIRHDEGRGFRGGPGPARNFDPRVRQKPYTH